MPCNKEKMNASLHMLMLLGFMLEACRQEWKHYSTPKHQAKTYRKSATTTTVDLQLLEVQYVIFIIINIWVLCVRFLM